MKRRSRDEPILVEQRPGEDPTLAHALHSRLRGDGLRRLRVALRDGMVRLSGVVDRLWRKRWLEERAAQLPGVRRVDVSDVEVEVAGVPDGEIAWRVRALLGGASSIKDETLAVTVHDGHVVLHGTALSPEEWQYAGELISRVEGVRSFTNRTVEAPRRKEHDEVLARRLRSRVARGIGGTEVKVAVVGRTAVLRGSVPQPELKREIERAVTERAPGMRIVNRLHVAFP